MLDRRIPIGVFGGVVMDACIYFLVISNTGVGGIFELSFSRASASFYDFLSIWWWSTKRQRGDGGPDESETQMRRLYKMEVESIIIW